MKLMQLIELAGPAARGVNGPGAAAPPKSGNVRDPLRFEIVPKDLHRIENLWVLAPMLFQF